VTGRTLVAVLPTRARAEAALARLRAEGAASSALSLVAPRGPAEAGEDEGIGAVIGGVVGGAGGASLALGAAGMLVPGVGPVILIGAVASALAGVAGGAAVGATLDRAATQGGAPGGRPEESPAYYRDALRRGRALVAAPADGAAERYRRVLQEAGAERVELVGDDWWRSLHLTEGPRPAG
jgi:hypothetical protein